MNFEDLLLRCDALIKQGKIRNVSEMIREISFAQVPRRFRQPLAKVCRRSGLIDHGLRLLFPVIRNERPLDQPASAAEICEYAVLLSRNGSVDEALTLLRPVDQMDAPEKLLYQGFCHVSLWNYFQAAQDFEEFLNSGADDYSKLIARVNLVAAYGAIGELEKADHLLTETMELAEAAQSKRLLGNCYELRGQVAFLAGDFHRSRAELAKSQEVLGQIGSYDQLLVSKWLSTMDALETQTLKPLLKFREEASQQKHWESVRDTDYYSLRIQFDQQTFDRLLYGTPSPDYRNRVLKESPRQQSEFFIYGSQNGGLLFDLQTGELSSGDRSIAGTKIHQLLAALVKDFYTPRNLGTLFAELYPQEYFNIDSSPVKVRQILRRTRRWLEQNQIPAIIDEMNGSYRLTLQDSFSIRIAAERPSVDGWSAHWQKLRQTFSPAQNFSADHACQVLGISRTAFHRFLAWAFENHLILKSGVNKSTVYQIIEKRVQQAS